MVYVASYAGLRRGFTVSAGETPPRLARPAKPARKPRADKGRKRGPRKPRT